MPYQIFRKSEPSNWVKLSCELTVHDFQELQTLSRLSRKIFGAGVRKQGGRENSYFLEGNGESMSKLAFVGDEK